MYDKTLEAEVDAYVDEVWDDVLADIATLVAVESVEDLEHAEPGKPYGPAPFEAMTRALGIAERLGLEAHDVEGHIGYADLVGQSDTYLATIAHSDIVPLGTGWTVDPLSVTRRDGYLLGRGVLDDKGPLVLSLYAAHFFSRKVAAGGDRLPYTLRCIVGANEETAMADVDYYLEHFPEPAFCFSPDAMFPLICGEKGRFDATFASPWLDADEGRIVSLDGGTAPNAIPGLAEAVVRAEAATLGQAPGIVVSEAGIDVRGHALARVVAHGKGGHASMPEGTVNAIGMLMAYLEEQGLCEGGESDFAALARLIFADTDGTALGIAAIDDVFDPLTCIGGTVRTVVDGGRRRFEQTIDARYPKSTDGGRIHAQVLAAATSCGCSLVEHGDSVPFYVSPDSPEIQVLLGTYNEVYGRDDKALTIGGGTYARHFKNACAFGPMDLAAVNPDWVGFEHGPDEGVSERELKLGLKIYILSIAQLMDLEFAC